MNPPRSRPGYVELHCHSAYSFLDGASAPEELARAAAELGYPALALTDHDGVWGAMEFAEACKAFGVRPIVGAELTVHDSPPPPALRDPDWRGDCPPGCFHLTFLAQDATGWQIKPSAPCSIASSETAGGRGPRSDRGRVPA